jgi:hypothetical protein
MAILLMNKFLTNLLSISTKILKINLGFYLGTDVINCLYRSGVITTGLIRLNGSF